MECLGVSNQEDIICKVRGMDFRDLLGLIVDHPFYLTDAYFTRISDAIRARYVALSNRYPRPLLVLAKWTAGSP